MLLRPNIGASKDAPDAPSHTSINTIDVVFARAEREVMQRFHVEDFKVTGHHDFSLCEDISVGRSVCPCYFWSAQKVNICARGLQYNWEVKNNKQPFNVYLAIHPVNSVTLVPFVGIWSQILGLKVACITAPA